MLEEFEDYKATAGYTDENIHYALTIHEGDSIPGFPSVNAFIYLLRPQLEKLKDPIQSPEGRSKLAKIRKNLISLRTKFIDSGCHFLGD